MHNKLFEQGVAGGIKAFKEYAQILNLDTEKFNACLDSNEMAKEVELDILAGQKAGVGGTPAFIVNGKMISGAQPFSVFAEVIEAELNG